jgi:hypothetical protein
MLKTLIIATVLLPALALPSFTSSGRSVKSPGAGHSPNSMTAAAGFHKLFAGWSGTTLP